MINSVLPNKTIFDPYGGRSEGEGQNDKRHGQGTFFYASGGRYEGEWQNDKRHGQGTDFYTSGDRYVGEWEDGKRDGMGVFFYASGGRYEGDWQNGKRHGQGTEFFARGGRYAGEWKDDKAHGKGEFYYTSGGRYEGEWQNNKRHGQGTDFYTSGDRYEGEWNDNKRDGEGKLFLPNGECFIVQYSQEKLKFDELTYLSNSLFLSVLLGKQGIYFPLKEDSLRYMHRYIAQLTKPFNLPENILERLSEAILPCDMRLQGAEHHFISEETYKNLTKNNCVLLIYASFTHAMGLQLKRVGNDTICEIFNSGYGLTEYHEKMETNNNKFQTRLQIKIPDHKITSNWISQLMEVKKDVQTAYNFIIQNNNAEVMKTPEEEVIWQTQQKGSNCAIEWIFAYLKYELGPEKYKKFRIKLFQDCRAQIAQRLSETNDMLEREKNRLCSADCELRRKIEKRENES